MTQVLLHCVLAISVAIISLPSVSFSQSITVTVPDVFNQTELDAATTLMVAGLFVSPGPQENHPTVAAGRAVRTIPAAGTIVDEESVITLILSAGPPPPSNVNLNIGFVGTGAGKVTAIEEGVPGAQIIFSSKTLMYPSGAIVTLSATGLGSPPNNSTFTGWSGGGCSGTGSCMVTLTSSDITVTANFDPPPVTRTVTVTGTGGGTGRVTGPGIDCGTNCTTTVADGSSLTLAATPLGGSTFTGWNGGGCSGTGSCTVTPSGSDVTVFADFAPPPVPTRTVTVTKTGTGSGTVTGPGINCGGDCSGTVDDGSSLTLQAAASGGSTFTGWSGGCSGTGSCTVTPIGGNVAVSANFDGVPVPSRTVTVTTTGTGSGTVTGPGVNCGADCSGTVDDGSSLTLQATANTGSTFTGWSGGCSGTGSCTVTPIGGDVAVEATFTLDAAAEQHILTVTKSGTGSGTVTSNSSGIDCGTDCSESYPDGTEVTLTASADAGSIFDSWSGGVCSGTDPCTVTMLGARTVEALFVSTSEVTLLSSVLPSSRSVQVGFTATAFGLLINSGATTAIGCGLAPSAVAPNTSIPADFNYGPTDPLTNVITGTLNTPVDIPADSSQTFVFGLTPTSSFDPTDVALNFSCINRASTSNTVGLNTLLLSASATPIPDIVALVATPTNDGIIHLPGSTGGISSTGVFVVASLNVGTTDTLTISADTGNVSLPLGVTLCETNPATGACLDPPSSSVTTSVGAGETPSFGIFVEGLGLVQFNPAINRIFIRYKDEDGVTRGSTSLAVQTP